MATILRCPGLLWSIQAAREYRSTKNSQQGVGKETFLIHLCQCILEVKWNYHILIARIFFFLCAFPFLGFWAFIPLLVCEGVHACFGACKQELRPKVKAATRPKRSNLRFIRLPEVFGLRERLRCLKYEAFGYLLHLCTKERTKILPKP